jgi:predicted dehydrogenase
MSDKNDTTPFRWAILGPGRIAKQFCQGVQQSLPDARVVAVGSRSLERAEAFGDEFGIPNRYGSYEELVADPEVDAVYIATPHPAHKENCLLTIEAGKAILCEKPFTVNAAEAETVVAAARAKGVFLLEAMKTRFYPAMVKVRELLAAGAIGEPRMLHADFGFRTGFNPEGRLFAPELAGGALLDVGVYCVSLASMIFGEPSRVTGLATLGETGVDEQSAMLLGYEGGELAVLSTAIRTSTTHEATIFGTEGHLRIHKSAWGPRAYTLSTNGERVEIPTDGNGFNFEAAEVQRCVAAGLTESPSLPLDESIAIMRTMDQLRAQWGLRYPME